MVKNMKLEVDKNKKRAANYIRYLFRVRSETFRSERWNCILRAGRLKVVRQYQLEPTDYIIMECFLLPEELPSKVSICLAVRKNWHLLSEANTEVSVAFDIAELPPAISSIKDYLKRLSRLLNHIKLWSRVRLFIAKRIRKPGDQFLDRE